MLEIVILYFVYRRFSRVARSKGRSGAWGWFGVAMWVTAEFLGIGLIDPSVFGSADDPLALLRLSAFGFAFGLIGLAAAWLIMRNLEPLKPIEVEVAEATEAVLSAAGEVPVVTAGPQRAVPETEPAPPGSTFAGFCEECDKMVWLTADQGCPVHGRDTVGSIHRPA